MPTVGGLWLLASLGAAWLLSLFFYPALRLPTRRRLLAGLLLAPLVAMAPLLVPASAPLGRFASAIWTGVLILKLWDLHLGAERGRRPTWTEMMAFMATPTSLVHRRTEAERQPGGWANLGRLLTALVVGGVALWAFYEVVAWDWSGTPFLAEHAVKGTLFFVFATAFFDGLVALVRGLGGYSVDPGDRPLRSRTPAEFWRRYNRCVGEFLREDVFRISGGLRHPFRATMGAFLVSGLLHEYIFAVALGTVLGYQIIFFLIQGVAVALTLRARPGLLLGVAGTFAFNLVSSVPFFAHLHMVAPFYGQNLPGWLWGPL